MLAENLAKFQINFLDPSIERANLDFLHMVFAANFNHVKKLKIGKFSAPYDAVSSNKQRKANTAETANISIKIVKIEDVVTG